MPGKRYQIGEQGKGEGSTDEGAPNVGTDKRLACEFSMECLDTVVVFAENRPVINSHGPSKFLSKVYWYTLSMKQLRVTHQFFFV
jgi:hypothetical protein